MTPEIWPSAARRRGVATSEATFGQLGPGAGPILGSGPQDAEKVGGVDVGDGERVAH